MDDIILFGHATEKEAEAFLRCLHTYCEWSGQAVNFQKSTVYFSKGVPKNRADKIANLLGMCKMKRDSTYLGLPLFWSTNRAQCMDYLVKKVLNRIDGWKSRLLSKVGRTCLIQSVGASLPIYVAASNVIPCRTASKIDKCLGNFWWGGSDSRKPIHTIAWSSLCKSKDALPSREKLGQIMPIPSVCSPLCDEEVESTIHLFWQCSFAKAFWYGSPWGIRTDAIQCNEWMDWLQWFYCIKNLPSNLDIDTFLTGALCIFDVLWSIRNRVIHGSNITPV
ncbi:hypothetical protein G4B88_014812 [Cannabis sativa]|uniref:Reverse transcriptase domain-containing protein n=1 Tax=Cannabis sativa TaxID=3483 RepID=A0A7J6IAN9_CANSA|nr:hypothetical protein G4B88_014812 [Cannabis sativa]